MNTAFSLKALRISILLAAAILNVAAQTQPSACGSQPLCYDAADFTATVTSFRVSAAANRQKIIDITVRFQNKATHPIILGYVNQSGIATDDRGNRSVPWGPNAYRGIGLVAGNDFEPKLVIRAAGWGDAQFEFVQQGWPQVVGFTHILDLTVAQIDTLEGNQHTLGGEFPMHFEGLRNGSGATSTRVANAGAQVPQSSSILGGIAGIAGAAHPNSASRANAAAESVNAAGQQAQATGANDAANTANGVSSGASAVGGIAGAAGNSQAAGTAGRVSNTASAASALVGMFKRKQKSAPQQGDPVQQTQQSQQQGQPQVQPFSAQGRLIASSQQHGANETAAEPWMPPASGDIAPPEPSAPLNPLKLPDVMGIHLGMTPQEAVPIMHKQFPANYNFQEIPPQLWPVAYHVYEGLTASDPRTLNAPLGYVSFTGPPKKPLVWHVARYTRGMHATRENVVAALREKYGRESVALVSSGMGSGKTSDIGQMQDMFWLFDERGGRVPLPPDSTFPNGQSLFDCRLAHSGDWALVRPDSGALADDSEVLKNRPGWCSSMVVVHAHLPDPRPIIDDVVTEMIDVPLLLRTAHASVVWRLGIADKQRQAELDKAKKSKPSF
jgi:hypothetical protein